MTVERKAKRRLKNFDFTTEGAHLALVHKEQGGPANEVHTLVMKSTANFTEEVIQKMQKISVEFELPDFLQKMFGMYWDDAHVLAALMGYKPESEDEEEEDSDSYYREWIESRLESFTVLKSLHESESMVDVLSKLDGETYLALLRDQERVEKALKKKPLDSETPVEKSTEQPVVAEKTKPKARIVKKVEKEGHKAEVTEAVEKQAVVADEANPAVEADSKTEVHKMTVATVQVEKTEQVEMVEKAQFELIQKALEEQKEELQKARDLLAQFEKERKEAIAKARKDALVAAVEKTEEAEVLFKAVGELEEEAFQAVVGVLKSLAAKTEADPMFREEGSSEEGEQVQKSALRAKLEAKYKTK